MNTLRELFSRVNKVERIHGMGECWEWPGKWSSQRYGSIRFRGQRTQAHRVVFALCVGPIDGIVVRHMCDNKACCNPSHLEPGTHADNIRDFLSRKGAGLGYTTADSVADVRRMARAGERDENIARKLGISVSGVIKARTGRRFGITGGEVLYRATKMSDDERSTCLDLYSRGHGCHTISKKTGRNIATVWRWLKKAERKQLVVVSARPPRLHR